MSGSLILKDGKKFLQHIKQQGVWVLAGRVYMMGMSLLSSIIMARILTTDQYGQYKYVTAIFALAAIFSVPEAAKVVVRYVPRGFKYVCHYLLSLRLKYSIMGSLALIAYGIYYSKVGGEIYQVFFILAVLFPVYNSYQLYDSYLQANLEYKKLNYTYAIKSTLQVVSFAACYFITKSLILSIAAMFLSLALLGVFYYYKYVPRSKIYGMDCGELRNESLKLSLFSVLPVFADQFDKLFIGDEIGYEFLAIYTIGYVFGQTVNGFFKPFMTSVSAKLVKNKINMRQYVVIFLFGSCIGFLLAGLGGYVFEYFYGEKYKEGYRYSSVILMSMGLYFLQTMYYSSVVYHKSSSLRSIYINNTATPIIVLVYMFLCTRFSLSTENMLLALTMAYPIKFLTSILILAFYDLIYGGGKNAS